MRSARILREKIRRPTPTVGVICALKFWPGLIEHLVRAGMDYLIIDCEHMRWNEELVAEACGIGRREDFPVLIRPPSAEETVVRLALDLGPCGLLVPYAESAGTLDRLQQVIWMPPRGRRRPGGPSTLWLNEYHAETWKREVEDDFLVLPQIESRQGLAAVDEIARHPLTTAVAVGPYDLSADLGVCWQPQHPALVEGMERIRQAATRAGKPMWNIGDAVDLVRRGFTFVCVSDPILLLEDALRRIVQGLKSGPVPGPGAAPSPPP